MNNCGKCNTLLFETDSFCPCCFSPTNLSIKKDVLVTRYFVGYAGTELLNSVYKVGNCVVVFDFEPVEPNDFLEGGDAWKELRHRLGYLKNFVVLSYQKL